MATYGVLEELRPTDLFSTDRGDLARPGDPVPAVLTTGRSKEASKNEAIEAALRASSERDRDRAKLHAENFPNSTSLAALAQCHAALNEEVEAINAARLALESSVVLSDDSDVPKCVTDPSSARIAADVMLQFGMASEAYGLLSEAEGSESIALTKATLALDLGLHDRALMAIDGFDGPMFDAFRGYLFAFEEKYQRAIPYLRAALRMAPDDVDSALNLSVSLWNIGAHRKATTTALRASRIAPGRKDVSMHYMELLLAQGETDKLASELRHLRAQGVVPDAQFLVLEGRLLLATGAQRKAVTVLERALEQARKEHDRTEEGAIASNLVALRYELGRIDRSRMAQELERLLDEFPDNDAVAVNFVRVADHRSHAGKLRRALNRVSDATTPTRRAFLSHHIAFLEGDNEAAGAAALEWFESERDNPHAAAAALVAIGIGLERWSEAEAIANYARANLPPEPALVNNVAYVLAMVGRAKEAIDLLKKRVAADDGFVLRATFGLAHLATGDLDQGMRLYREAAERAEKDNPAWSALMATYQALVVRQLGLDKSSPEVVLEALALAPRALPDDWEDRPDFLRLKTVCDRNGYPWPLDV